MDNENLDWNFKLSDVINYPDTPPRIDLSPLLAYIYQTMIYAGDIDK